MYPGTERIERSEDKIEGGETIDDFQIKVPQALGTPAAVINQLQSCQAMKNLGVYTPPEGNCEPQFAAMREKVDDWTTKMKAGCLLARSAWLSYQC